MSARLAELYPSPSNPLDSIEEFLNAREWSYERSSEDELVVEVTGRWTDYKLFFFWREELNTLHYTCMLDIRVPEKQQTTIYELLARINEKLWIGHFDISMDNFQPSFRHALPFRGVVKVATEQFQDLIEASLEECEKFFPAFQMVIWGGKTAIEALDTALFETAGEA
jgi:hypothetical protein